MTDKTIAQRATEAATHMVMGAATTARNAMNVMGVYDVAVGAAVGVVKTAVNGGNIVDNVKGGIAQQEAITKQGQEQYQHAANAGKAIGAAAVIASTGGAGTTVVAANATGTVARVHGAYKAYDVSSAAVEGAGAVANSGRAVLGELATPSTPKVASAGQSHGRGA